MFRSLFRSWKDRVEQRNNSAQFGAVPRNTGAELSPPAFRHRNQSETDAF
jgi:hypothetical protein